MGEGLRRDVEHDEESDGGKMSKSSGVPSSGDSVTRISQQDFLNELNQTVAKSQDAFDRTVLALSGGAFGVSLAIFKDLLGHHSYNQGFIVAAWVSWTISLAAGLWSHFSSVRANQAAANAWREHGTMEAISRSSSGYETLTTVLNVVSGAAFVLGCLFVVCFVSQNIGGIR
ncbi:MAG: hypothetical protein C3F08_00365 [Candidatus Methylomirabilota bacterium]|nr:MAG: hypothetical protein C3F08_00365 [candidate division NC10 bacterium]